MGIVIGQPDNATDHEAFAVYVIGRLGLEDRLLQKVGKMSVCVCVLEGG